MLDINERTQSGKVFPIAQWVQQVLGSDFGRIKVRHQGQRLQIFCEASPDDQANKAIAKLVAAIAQTDLQTLLPPAASRLEEIRLYGRGTDPQAENWTEVIHLDRLQSVATPAEVEPPKPAPSGGFMLVSLRSLASEGRAEAIARYLSDTFAQLGVRIRVKVKTLRKTSEKPSEPNNETLFRRLYVHCESTYSPDPSLLAPSIAEKLRELNLPAFRDAILSSQVIGEPEPDWVLRVDLTPNEVWLRDWGRWGDVPAISRLLNQALADQNVRVSAILKESTLHLFCTGNTAPDQTAVTQEIRDLLEKLAPQGIYAATLYGHITEHATPNWVDWIDLPAKDYPDLAVSTITLAEQGDRQALSFLLNRLLNPELEQQLLTGGIRIQLVSKEDLLHIMTEAPVCPSQTQVGPLIAKFLRQLKVLGIAGVRIYGRRAGQKLPRWSYGIDFAPRKRLVPEATPEFAASSAFVSELMNPDTGDSGTENGFPAFQDQLKRTLQTTQQGLIRSGCFVPQEEAEAWSPSSLSPSKASVSKGGTVATACVWSIVGLLLTLQLDWIVGTIVQPQPVQAQRQAPKPPSRDAQGEALNLAGIMLQSAPSEGDRQAFSSTGFTRPHSEPLQLRCTPSTAPESVDVSCSLAPPSPYPPFNNKLLDEHLGRYFHVLRESGPPDVLIVGSSRALRGINPVAMQEALAAQGYTNVRIYNFGVNGATAQVVDLILRRILTANQLPKMIVWADGTRAFNSGRADLTYEAIAASQGYTQLMAGTLLSKHNAKSAEITDQSPMLSQLDAVTEAYQQANQWLDARLGSVSLVYPLRDRLQGLLGQQLAHLLPTLPQTNSSPAEPDTDTDSGSVTADGFLPFSIRFDAQTYYQTHPRVSGDYDRDYESFQLEGKQIQALESLLKLTQSRSIPLVFVNMPLTQDYLDVVRSKYEKEFQRRMLGLSMEKGFVFRDVTRLWQGQNYEYFSDPSHLNRYGADAIANYLANDPMIPWSAVLK